MGWLSSQNSVRATWSAIGVILTIIGLGGLPGDIQGWRQFFQNFVGEKALEVATGEGGRWLVLLFGMLAFTVANRRVPLELLDAVDRRRPTQNGTPDVVLRSSSGPMDELQLNVLNTGATATFYARCRILKQVLYPRSHPQSKDWTWPTGTYSLGWVGITDAAAEIRTGDSYDLLLGTTTLFEVEGDQIFGSGLDLKEFAEPAFRSFDLRTFEPGGAKNRPQFRWTLEVRVFSDKHSHPAVFQIEVYLSTWSIRPKITSLDRLGLEAITPYKPKRKKEDFLWAYTTRKRFAYGISLAILTLGLLTFRYLTTRVVLKINGGIGTVVLAQGDPYMYTWESTGQISCETGTPFPSGVPVQRTGGDLVQPDDVLFYPTVGRPVIFRITCSDRFGIKSTDQVTIKLAQERGAKP